MEIITLIRGNKQYLDEFKAEMSGKFLPMKFRAPDEKQLRDVACQIGVRPYEIIGFAFPEEHLELVCQTLFRENIGGKPQHKYMEKFFNILRKMLKLEKIPPHKYDPDTAPGMPIMREHLDIMGLGIKRDYFTDLSGNHLKERKEGCYEGL